MISVLLVADEVAFRAELWVHPGESGWHFVTMPLDLADEVRARAGHVARGFGSLRVRARVGGTSWTTSVFPSREGAYLLPVKQQVRRAEGLDAGEPVDVALELLDL